MLQPAALYLLAVFGITSLAVVAVVALEVLRPDGVNSQATYTILGICTPTLAVLIGLVKSISNGQAAEAAKEEARATRVEARQTAAAVKDVLEQSAKADSKPAAKEHAGPWFPQ